MNLVAAVPEDIICKRLILLYSVIRAQVMPVRQQIKVMPAMDMKNVIQASH